MKLRIAIIVLGIAICSGSTLGGNYAKRKEVQDFIESLCKSDGFDKTELTRLFSRVKYQQQVVDAISRPAEKVLKWDDYQDIFLTRKRIAAGQKFLLNNRDALVKAKNEYGVPPSVVASIIGVETMYGRYRGSYRVIDSLSTLAFDYPPRAQFFRSQLRQFLLLAREEHRSPTEPLGSYAGAMGYGQFTPSSFREYAVDFDGDGERDIWNDRADAIGSVANYLARHGWREGQPITMRVEPSAQSGAIFTDAIRPSMTLGQLKSEGIATDVSMKDDTRVAPILFEGKDGPEYWLGLHNFYVITRYNHSKLYAMAVFQLSKRLEDFSATADNNTNP
ncbi:MAG TPA: lytic murein transglycosylase B [Pseudomonadales bacterium]|nr:lytic murein transglycosylase B [Pseudomonadales bacterium]